MKKSFVFILMFLASAGRVAAQELKINVSDARFTAPLVEKLIKEYNKVDPNFHAQVLTQENEKSDARVSLDNEASTFVLGRYFILPIANSQNELLSNRKIKKGLSERLVKQLFLSRDYLEVLDAEENGEKELPGTVYSLTGSRAITTKVFAKALNTQPSQIRGKKIVGREENVISVVKNHEDAVSFNVASLVYDTQSAHPVSGLTVLPIDLDDNGKISDDERAVFSDVNQLASFIDQKPETTVPSGNVYIDTHNPQLSAFANWVSSDGLQILHQYGYLKANQKLSVQN